ncbi:MAG: hypothetical protein L6Q57_08625 [Alphaproteobacteria bacterium]|nr:hypothetical protein [Alphaproteobacteria bacterium]
MTQQHFNQTPRRRAEFIKPPNTIKAKVGSGGLAEEILDRAQRLLENNTVDFLPLAEIYLSALQQGIHIAKHAEADADQEYVISTMIYPAMQLKANGGMFHYPLVTALADRLIQFLEVIEEADLGAVEIVLAFHTSIRAVVVGRVTGSGGVQGVELQMALEQACTRYFDKNPDNINPEATRVTDWE